MGTLDDGRTVFVPRTAPGDLVELRELRISRRFARARLSRLLETSQDRVPPRCPHYDADECGGCQLQHLSSEAQRAARTRLVGDALRHVGRLEVGDPALEASGQEWEYRSKITLTVRAKRIGYHRLGQPGRVFDLLHCAIARPELNALWRGLRAHRDLLPRHLDQLVLRIDRQGGRHALMKTASGEAWTTARRLGECLDREGLAAVLWWEPDQGAPRAVFGALDPYPITVFEQVHPVMGDRARGHAVAALGDIAGQHVWDLFAGIGETTRALLERGATVESVEADPRAVRLAEQRGPAAGATRITGRVEEVIDRLAIPEAVILNPPRTGLPEQVVPGLIARRPRRVVYVSCDPATLARDLSRLAPGYRIVAVRAFDLFPQTAHVETVTLLELE